MIKTIMKAIILCCPVAGIILWLNNYHTAGIGLVIGGYIFYIAVRLIPRLKRADSQAKQEVVREKEEAGPKPDSWVAMRDKALEALSRKLRNQKIAVNSFFTSAHARYPALVKVREDLEKGADPLELKTDLEILRLQKSPEETQSLFEELSGKIQSEEELLSEIKSLRARAQA